MSRAVVRGPVAEGDVLVVPRADGREVAVTLTRKNTPPALLQGAPDAVVTAPDQSPVHLPLQTTGHLKTIPTWVIGRGRVVRPLIAVVWPVFEGPVGPPRESFSVRSRLLIVKDVRVLEVEAAETSDALRGPPPPPPRVPLRPTTSVDGTSTQEPRHESGPPGHHSSTPSRRLDSEHCPSRVNRRPPARVQDRRSTRKGRLS